MTVLRRSRRRRVLAGVCGGIAEGQGWSPWIVRLAFVIGSVVPILPGFVVYILMWLAVPLEDESGP